MNRSQPAQPEDELAEASGSTEALSTRGLLVLQLLACGYTLEQIAAMLGTTRDDIAQVVARAMRKLGAPDRRAAVQTAIAQGRIITAPAKRSAASVDGL